MMGQQCRSESLFYYFRIEDHVPENNLLRLIDRHVSFDFVREKLKPFYSDTGRPSIDPERLLRILLIGYGRAECGRTKIRGNGSPIRSGAETAYTSTDSWPKASGSPSHSLPPCTKLQKSIQAAFGGHRSA